MQPDPLLALLSHPMTPIVGIVATLYVLYSILSWICTYCLPGFLCGANLKNYGAKKGSWAVVTGASDGIGKGIAFALAARGMNIALVSRTASKLQAVADEIKQKYPKCETTIVVADVNQANTSDVVKSIVDPLSKLPVSMLINNVGINTDGSFPAELTDHSVAEVESMIRVNCTFTALLTRAFIPILKQNVKPRAAIVNLGSMSSLFPSAMMSIYAGTKAFDDAFSYALTAELKQFKIDVTSVLPGYVTSSMSNIKRSSILVPSEKSFGHLVASVIGSPRSIPYWAHSLYVAVITRLPDSFVFKKVVRNMKDIRGRLLARAAKKATEAKQQ